MCRLTRTRETITEPCLAIALFRVTIKSDELVVVVLWLTSKKHLRLVQASLRFARFSILSLMVGLNDNMGESLGVAMG